jgi:hypothetical protein
MAHPKRLSLLLLSLLAAAIACGPIGAPSPIASVEPGSVASMVAATLTALGPPEVGDTPAPPLSASPTHTEIPPAPPSPVLRIVYTSGGEAWVLEGAGPPRQLTHTGGVQTVVISDDGRRVSYLRRDSAESPAELRAISLDGTADIPLLTSEQANSLHSLAEGLLRIEPSQFDFSPGTHDLFINTRAIAEGPGLLKFNDLYKLDADTGHLTLVLPAEQGGDFSVSPDGSQIAIVQPDSVSMANIDGSDLRPDLVTFDPVLTYSEYQYYPTVVWAADSSAAGVVIPSREPLGADPTASVWRVPAHAGSGVRQSTLAGESFFFGMGPHSLLSPDLNRVAYTRETTTPDVYQLVLVEADGSGEVVYATGRFFWQGWGPDSVHFLFGSGLPAALQLGQVGGSPSIVEEGTDVRWLNATEYAFLTGSPGTWELRRGVLGGPATVLVASTAQSFSYDFTQ